ncbi:alpha/beta hydrolase family protein [Gordonia sp. NPDC003376]
MELRHPTHRAYSRGFYPDDGRDFEVRLLLGYAASGGSDAGEVLTTIDGLGDGHPDAWADAWLALGRRVASSARAAQAGGHTISAASAYLRAANYLSTAFDGLDGIGTDSARLAVFAEHRAAWDGFLECGPFTARSIEIPYEGTTLPGWFVGPDRATTGGLRPTLVMVNGSDGSVSAVWCAGARAALERGYNVLLFDGPGQQSMLFEHGMGFRPDWEAVLTPVTDTLLGLPEVDPDRLAVYGISQAGYWVPRALAVEHRYAAAVADPGVVDVSASWLTHMPKSLVAMLDDPTAATKFDRDMKLGMTGQKALQRMWEWRARPYGSDGHYFDVLQRVREYTLTDQMAAQITTPMLITSPEGEQFWPGQSERLAAMMTSARTDVVDFTAAEGASGHCQPMGRALTAERMFDWLDTALAAR